MGVSWIYFYPTGSCYLSHNFRPYSIIGPSLISRCIISIIYFAESHDWLLSEEVDILPRLLLPLAGPEEFDADDNDKLPPDLQYLEPEKTREPDPEIRKQLVESIHQVGVKKKLKLYFLAHILLVTNLILKYKIMQKPWKMTETLAHGYSSESRELVKYLKLTMFI